MKIFDPVTLTRQQKTSLVARGSFLLLVVMIIVGIFFFVVPIGEFLHQDRTLNDVMPKSTGMYYQAVVDESGYELLRSLFTTLYSQELKQYLLNSGTTVHLVALSKNSPHDDSWMYALMIRTTPDNKEILKRIQKQFSHLVFLRAGYVFLFSEPLSWWQKTQLNDTNTEQFLFIDAENMTSGDMVVSREYVNFAMQYFDARKSHMPIPFREEDDQQIFMHVAQKTVISDNDNAVYASFPMTLESLFQSYLATFPSLDTLTGRFSETSHDTYESITQQKADVTVSSALKMRVSFPAQKVEHSALELLLQEMAAQLYPQRVERILPDGSVTIETVIDPALFPFVPIGDAYALSIPQHSYKIFYTMRNGTYLVSNDRDLLFHDSSENNFERDVPGCFGDGNRETVSLSGASILQLVDHQYIDEPALDVLLRVIGGHKKKNFIP